MSMNETRLCVKLTAYNIYINTKITKHVEIVLACTSIQQAPSVRHACALCSHTETGCWMCHVTTGYTEQIDDCLSGVMRFLTLMT